MTPIIPESEKSPKADQLEVIHNCDGRAPVCLAIMSTRNDPVRSGVVNYRVSSAFAWAANNDEATGIGHRLAEGLWPTSDGWAASVAVCWVPAIESRAIAATVQSSQLAGKGE